GERRFRRRAGGGDLPRPSPVDPAPVGSGQRRRRSRVVIAKLRGILDSRTADSAVVDVGGVGYLVFCPTRTLDRLPPAGAPATLYVETHVREDHIHLYGFAEAEEREWFRLL